MPSRDALICFMFFPNFFTIFTMFNLMHSLFSMGKSKTRAKKERRSIMFCKKVLMCGYADRVECYPRFAKMLCYTYWAYISWWILGIIMLLLSPILSVVERILGYWILMKVFIFDIPFALFVFVMTDYSKKDGRIKWRWEK